MAVNLIFIDSPKTSSNLVFGAESNTLYLTSDTCTQQSTSSTASIVIYFDLVASNCSQNNSSTAGSISLNLSSDSTNQNSNSDSIVITQQHELVGSNSLQENISSNNPIIIYVDIVGSDTIQDNYSSENFVALLLFSDSCEQTAESLADAIIQEVILHESNCNQINTSSSNAIIIYVDVVGADVTQSSNSTEGSVSLQLSYSPSTQDNISTTGEIIQEIMLQTTINVVSNLSTGVQVQQIQFVLAEEDTSSTTSEYDSGNIPIKVKAVVLNNREVRIANTSPRTTESDVETFSNDGAQFIVDTNLDISPATIGLDSTETILTDPSYKWTYKSNEDQIWKVLDGAVSSNHNLTPDSFNEHRGDGKEVIYKIESSQNTFIPKESSFKIVLNDDKVINVTVYKPVEVSNSTNNIVNMNIPANCTTGKLQWMQVPYKDTYVAVPYLLKNNI